MTYMFHTVARDGFQTLVRDTLRSLQFVDVSACKCGCGGITVHVPGATPGIPDGAVAAEFCILGLLACGWVTEATWTREGDDVWSPVELPRRRHDYDAGCTCCVNPDPMA